ncbi:hypothetical protein [Gluconobacter potus]|uniref:hypothetical protein n=1 Tax=Gluconobacter potus TaxID=2724927 RepID=UPI0012DA6259|nr:hypothetical protein [Gluconobacter potus]
MKKFSIIGATVLVVAAAGIFYFRNPAPSCSSAEVERLTVEILGEQLKIPGSLSLTNIIEKSGGFFGVNRVCEADIQGIQGGTEMFGVKLNRVRYTSSVTQDTRRVYVTAKLAAFSDN